MLPRHKARTNAHSTRVDKSPRPRDRPATEARIVDAATSILSERGFTALAVNELARQAGVDKKLVARYFGGIEGVVDAIGAHLDLWLAGAARSPGSKAPPDYASLISRLLSDYSTNLRGNALVLRLLAWELVEPSPALARLESVRSRAMQKWMAAQKGPFTAPAGVDAPAVNALLLAGFHYLALRERTLPGFAGLDLSDPKGWRRVQAAASAMLALIYAPTKVRKARPAAKRGAP